METELYDLKALAYEIEFTKFFFLIFTPLKNALLKCFRSKNVRIDPLDEELFRSLLDNNYRDSYIAKHTYNDIVEMIV